MRSKTKAIPVSSFNARNMDHGEFKMLSRPESEVSAKDAARIPAEDSRDYLPAAYRAVNPATRGAWADQQPHCVFIEVTNHCNLLCETCPRTFTTYEEPKTLSWDNFLKIA